MTSFWTVLLSCLLLASQGWANMDNNQQIEEMMNNMMATKMVEVEERVETKLRGEMEEKDKEIEELRENMEKREVMREAMMDEMEEKVANMREVVREEMDKEVDMIREEMYVKVEVMREEMDKKVKMIREEMDVKVEMMREEMEEKDNTMKKELDTFETRKAEMSTKLKEVGQKSLRDLPYAMSCAYRHGPWTTPSATITYERLSADYNNSDRPGGGDGMLDISTGVYTALTAGHYTVTFSGMAKVDPGEKVEFQLMHNGKGGNGYGWWESASGSNNGGVIDDQGSWTLVSLERCTHLYLYTCTDLYR